MKLALSLLTIFSFFFYLVSSPRAVAQNSTTEYAAQAQDAVVVTGEVANTAASTTASSASKLLHFTSEGRVPGEYMVKFREIPDGNIELSMAAPNLLADSVDDVRRLVTAISKKYEQRSGNANQILAIWIRPHRKGFAIGNISERDIIDLASDPRVEFIEPNVTAITQTVTVQKTGKPNCSGNCAPWHLDRLDQRKGLDNLYHYDSTGAAVTMDVIDSGVQLNHAEFNNGNSAFEENSSVYDCTNANGCVSLNGQFAQYDCYGHGTAVASLAGGQTFGVAKGVYVNGLRTSKPGDCTGSLQSIAVINAVDFADDQKVTTGASEFGVVINMSFEFPAAVAMVDNAINDAINDGVTVVASAGNDNNSTNPCNFTPMRNSRVIRVGATDSSDTRASGTGGSNFGSCVDLFAPGVADYVADNGGSLFTGTCAATFPNTTAICALNGTSLSAPIVAGIAALYIQNNPKASPATVKSVVLANATSGAVINSGSGSPNLLAYVGVPGNNSIGVVGTGGGGVTPSTVVTSVIAPLLLIEKN